MRGSQGKGRETRMAVTLVVGDLHLKMTRYLPLLDGLVEREGTGRVVMCGDYCDDWGATPASATSELAYLAMWVRETRDAGVQVDCLVGNHDYATIWGDDRCSGTLFAAWPEERRLLAELGLEMATSVGDILVTHAGLTAAWADEEGIPEGKTSEKLARSLNAMYAGKRRPALYTAGALRGGCQTPGPLWADLRELAADPYPGLRQIVGHTPQLTAARVPDARGGEEIWACDTLSANPWGEPTGDATCLLVNGDGHVCPVSLAGNPAC